MCVTVIGGAPGLPWTESMLSTLQHGEGSAASPTALRCLLENYTGEQLVSNV